MKNSSKTCDDLEQGYEIILNVGSQDLLHFISFDQEIAYHHLNSIVEIEANFRTKIL